MHGLAHKRRASAALSACSLLAILLFGGDLRAAERVNWLSGPGLRKKLESRESIAWSGQPLRDALEGFSRTQRVAVLIDRRIDPGQPMEASLTNTPLAELLTAVAESRGMGVSLFESVVYLGPPATARRLRTVLEMRKAELNQLPSRQRLAWLQGRAWRWDDFATPRDLLGELAKEGKFEIKGLEMVPHDLWAAGDLPPLGLLERLTLVLGQFDYTYQLDAAAAAIHLQPMPSEVWVERTYPGGSKVEELAEKLTVALPGVKARVADGKLVVRGLVEQHEQIASGVIRSPKPSPGSEESIERKTFTLTATNQSVKAILESLQQQVGLELKYDAAKLAESGRSLDMLVSVTLKNASLDETLKSVLGAAGLTFRRMNKVVEIEAGERKE
jgi:hypothetical protein